MDNARYLIITYVHIGVKTCHTRQRHPCPNPGAGRTTSESWSIGAEDDRYSTLMLYLTLRRLK
jgi:hypothetical protein